MTSTQIYLATYSNVPVFEFVTSEGPIMRRKLDLWINATHILKIAKFPKAKRTRILEKDVQTGIHEKVQGGYGKYQGTYVPLELGREIADQFGVLEILKPIFDFQYVEGQLDTPPPAPKHNHALALNIHKKRPTKSGEKEPKKRGRPMKQPQLAPPVVLPPRLPPPHPTLSRSDTAPILPPPGAPSFGLFSDLRFASRQDTDTDQYLAGRTMTVQDLEEVDDDDEELNGNNAPNSQTVQPQDATPRDLFVKAVNAVISSGHNGHLPSISTLGESMVGQPVGPVSSASLGGSLLALGVLPNVGPSLGSLQTPPGMSSSTCDSFASYQEALINFFANDGKLTVDALGALVPPAEISLPPEPRLMVPINGAVDGEGNTIFHWVCLMGLVPELRFLLATFPHLNLDARNNAGETALMFLVKYNNPFQLRLFPELLELLEPTWSAVDDQGRTVLHHIVAAGAPELKKNRERVARYYLEELFEKMSQRPDFKSLLNQADRVGNTALHIAACLLKKKLIKLFLAYHTLINFEAKNAMDYLVENYLAAHNHVLRLDNALLELDEAALAMDAKLFELQLYFSKMAMNLHNNTSNAITEALTQLAYTIDKELAAKDETMLDYIKLVKQRRLAQLDSQHLVFRTMQLPDLVAAVESARAADVADAADVRNQRLLQEEVVRISNDLCFLWLHAREELNTKTSQYARALERCQAAELKAQAQAPASDDSQNLNETTESHFVLATELQRQILRRKVLTKKLASTHMVVPLVTDDGNKENFRDNRLQKYFKLISLACDLLIQEVESSIDLIEQLLLKRP